MNTPKQNLSVTQQLKFDAVCLRFEEAWRRQQNPTIESFLADRSMDERTLLLQQLMLVELEYRMGDAALSLEEYLDRFPNDHDAIRRAFQSHHLACAQDTAHSKSACSNEPSDCVNENRTEHYEEIAEQPGGTIGRYKLLEQIGEGGMGVVFMAEQQRPVRRKVALKVIKPGMNTSQVIARFEAERQALAMMDHPNIARVLDAGSTVSGRPYFVMELVRGTTVTDYCNQAKLDTTKRLELFKMVCQAVQHAHIKGIIHRDLKPTNVLITMHDGQPVPKIIDFGVSKAMGQQLTEKTLFTAFAQLVGTPLYMSPEQAEMSGLDVDTRSDIYSLGVLLYELLIGVTPFDRQRLQTAGFDEMRRIIREEDPIKPSTRVSSLGQSLSSVSAQRSTDAGKLRQTLKGELDWIVMKALEKDRNRRYETANALATEIDRYLKGAPIEAGPASTMYRVRKFVRRYRTQVSVAASFALLLLASSVVSWLLYVDARRAHHDVAAQRDRALDAEKLASQQRDVANLEKQRADKLATDLSLKVYDNSFKRALQAARQNENHMAASLLDDCPVDYRRWEWKHLDSLLQQRIPAEIELDKPALSVAPHPSDDDKFAVGYADGTIQMLSRATGEVLWSQHTDEPAVYEVRFSPGGKYLATACATRNPIQFGLSDQLGGEFQIRNSNDGSIVWQVPKLEFGVCGQASFSKDEQFVAVSTTADTKSSNRSSEIQLFRLNTGERLVATRCDGVTASLAFGPNGTRLYGSIAMSSKLMCWNTSNLNEVWERTLEKRLFSPFTSTIVVSRDSEYVLSGGAGHLIRVWNAKDGEEVTTLKGDLLGNISQILLSKDDRRCVSIGGDGFTVWDLPKQKPLRKVRRAFADADLWSPTAHLSNDENYLVKLDRWEGQRIQCFPVEAVAETRDFIGQQGAVFGLAFSPSQRQLASVASLWGPLVVWDTDTGQLAGYHPHQGYSSLSVSYSPDGTLLASGGSQGIELRDGATGRLLRRLPLRTASHLCFNSDSGKLLSCGHQAKDGGIVKVWDTQTGETLLSKQDAYVGDGVAFTVAEDGVVILTENGGIHVWKFADTAEAKQIREPLTLASKTWKARGLVRMPRTQWHIAGVGNAVELWDIDAGTMVRSFDNEAPIRSLAVNEDGSRICTGDNFGVVRILHSLTGEVLFKAQTDRGNIHSVVFSPDGKSLAVSGKALVRIWDTAPPSAELIRQRIIVDQAAKLVNEQFQVGTSFKDVWRSLTSRMDDESIDPQVLSTAFEIARVRGGDTSERASK